jgi:formate dehydrogenase subunit delta
VNTGANREVHCEVSDEVDDAVNKLQTEPVVAHPHSNRDRPDNLIKMANQIGSFFETMPNRSVAQDDIAKHLRSFWAPRMRHALLNYVEAHAGEGLSVIVLETMQSRRDAIF